jgi:hypothetical protein
MTNQPFRPAPVEHEIEVLHDGQSYKGRYHVEKNNLVVSYQGASKMVAQDGDDAALAKTVLEQIVVAKGRH